MKKYVFAFLIWVMIIPIAIINGGFREYVLVELSRKSAVEKSPKLNKRRQTHLK